RVQAQENVYDEFNRFCTESFGAEKESLVYDTFGKTLEVVESGLWKHVSETSACVAWETNLPARGHVEYGETPACGKSTTADERHFYLHTHYLRDLKPDTVYHFRLVSVDERGNRVTSTDRTFRTVKLAGAIRIPDDVKGPPFTLDRAGAAYLVTRDIVCDASAFNVTAPNVTLDLNGHTVTYNDKAGAMDEVGGGYIRYATSGPVGMRIAYSGRPVKLLVNGEIRQGKGAASGGAGGMQSAPVCGGAIDEVAGMTFRYNGPQVSGVVGSTRREFHHNVILDEGTKIINRHMGCSASRATAPDTHHNLVKRCRHRGFDGVGNAEFHHNEVYGDSWDTNAAGVMYYGDRNVKCHGNRFFGRGYMFIGVAVVSKDCRNIDVRENFIHLVGEEANLRSDEYGAMCNMSGLRFTPYGGAADDILFEKNVISLVGRGGSKLRGLWACPTPTSRNVRWIGNTVKVVADAETSENAQCVCVNGSARGTDAPVVLYEGNTFISNACNVRLAESYGASGNQRFVGNTLVRVGNDPRYHTVRCGWWVMPTTGNLFVDTTFKGGAGFDKVSFEGGPWKLSEKDARTHGHLKGERDFTVQWTLTVTTVPGAKITIKDGKGEEVFTGAAGLDGKTTAVLSQYTQVGRGAKGEGAVPSDSEKISHTPHTVTVEKDGRTVTRTVDMTAKKELDVPL
ncbi:MAG TPA: fibronectin type III domain-containing protein, partial [Planctomycetota bacterium]|nr:fibronectin type III domain-containing protein [Planctomycetota bacterium]